MSFFKIKDETKNTPVNQRRPWVRFFARKIDQTVFCLPLWLLVRSFLKGEPTSQEIFLGFFCLFFLFIFCEAWFLSRWGYTPGKWLLAVKVRELDGSLLNFKRALLRSLNVWVFGYAMLMPLVSHIAQALAYRQLTRYGSTYWDRGQFSVSHERIRLMTKILIGGLSFLIFLLLTFSLSKDLSILVRVESAAEQWEITLDPSWQTLPNRNEMVQAKNETDQATLSVSLVPSVDPDKAAMLEKLLDLMVAQFKEFHISGPLEGWVDNRPAVQIAIDGTIEKGTLGVLQTLVEVPSGMIVICFYAPQEKFESLLPSFQKMTETFHSHEPRDSEKIFY